MLVKRKCQVFDQSLNFDQKGRNFTKLKGGLEWLLTFWKQRK